LEGKGQVVLAIINYSKNETFEFHLKGIKAFTPRVEYWFSAPKGDLRTKETILNGQKLEFKDGNLPPINGKHSSDAIPIVANPLTYGYVVLLEAQANICQ